MYGKFEMRAKLPDGQGMWAAFWTLGDNLDEVGWPACGNIDIIEHIGRDPKNAFGKIHAPNLEKSYTYHSEAGFSSDFHTYSVNWQPERIDFYVDNN